MNDTGDGTPNRTIMIHTLAIVGFIALIGASMWLAVYSTRYVPTVVNRVGSAAVYLGSVFSSADKPTLSVIPTQVASTTISFAEETPSEIPAPPRPKTVPPAAGEKTTSTVQIAGTTTRTSSGLPDLIVTINAVGYLITASADSFLATSTVPAGGRPAVNFTIKNIGANTSGPWRFSASIPTQTAYIYHSPPQQSLAPGDSIDYTLGFDQSNKGSGQTVSITANFDRTVTESNSNNNGASANLTILGG